MSENDEFKDTKWNYNFYLELICQYYRLCSMFQVNDLPDMDAQLSLILEATFNHSLKREMIHQTLFFIDECMKELESVDYKNDIDYYEHSFAILLTYENPYSIHAFDVPDEAFMQVFKKISQVNIKKYHLNTKEWYKIIDLRFWNFCPLDISRISNEMSMIELEQERASAIYLTYGDDISQYIIQQSVQNLKGEIDIFKSIENFVDYLNKNNIRLGKLLQIDTVGNETFMPRGELILKEI